MPASRAHPDQEAALYRRRLFLAGLIIEAAQQRPGAEWGQLVADACRAGSRFGDTSAWPDPQEFEWMTGLTLPEIATGRLGR